MRRKGNLNIVEMNFLNQKMELTNGEVIPLDSDVALNTILYSMMADDNVETAASLLISSDLRKSYKKCFPPK